jgi:small-conductance mechanosensitive channel
MVVQVGALVASIAAFELALGVAVGRLLRNRH